MIPAGATWHRGIDLVAVDRVLRGAPPLPELTEEEQKEAIRLMTEAGLSASVIAGRLGVTPRSVVRWRVAGGGDGCP